MYFQNPVNTSTLASANGVVNYFRNVGNLNQEMVSCFNKTAPFVMSNMGVVNSSGMVDNQASCKSTDAAGGRTQVVTQVYIKRQHHRTISHLLTMRVVPILPLQKRKAVYAYN